jgi:hypothetical protein
MPKSDLDAANSSEEFGKLGSIDSKKDLSIGEIKVPAGEYTCGFNADEKGNFYFVVWEGNEAKKTKLEPREHGEATIPNLTMMMGPHDDHSVLMIGYGKHFAILPVQVGEIKAAVGSTTDKTDVPKYVTGMEQAGEEILSLTYPAVPAEDTKIFEAMKKGEVAKNDLDRVNNGEKFGKLSSIATMQDLSIGEIKVPAGKHTCGFNADEKGDFYFVVWVGNEAKKTKLEIQEHKEAKIPNATMTFVPQENHSALMIMWNKYYTILPVQVGDAKPAAGSSTDKAAAPKVDEKETAKADEKGDKTADEDEASDEEDEGWDTLETHSFSGR